MNINKVFSGGFLKAEDLQGKKVRVTIAKVEVKAFDDGNKIIVHFQNKDKALVCNKTNASIIAHNASSPDTDNWIGTTHFLGVKMVEFKGELVPAIRVVINEDAPVPSQAASPIAPPPTPPAPAPQPAAQQPLSAEPEDDDVPF